MNISFFFLFRDLGRCSFKLHCFFVLFKHYFLPWMMLLFGTVLLFKLLGFLGTQFSFQSFPSIVLCSSFFFFFFSRAQLIT
jgi:hypothetical protein